MTSCFVYKVMRLTFHDRIDTQLFYRIAVAQVVTWRITKPQKHFQVRISLAALFYSFFFLNFLGRGGGGGLILLFSSCLIFFFLFIFLLLFFIFYPFNMYKVHI